MRIFEIETEEIYSADYFGCVPVSNPADLSDEDVYKRQVFLQLSPEAIAKTIRK